MLHPGRLDFDVPLDCAVTVTATCDTVTFHTYLGPDWRSVLQILYGDEGSIPLGDAEFTSDTVTIPLDYNPFSYEVRDREMGRQFDDLLTLDCDDSAIPTVAPASGV